MGVNAHPTLRWRDIDLPRPEWAALSNGRVRFHYTYNARAALYQLLLSMPRSGRDVVLLPAFHCTTVVEPALRAGWNVRFYRIRTDLSIDLEHLSLQLSNEIAAILVIHFLGFPAPLENVRRMSHEAGCYLIEDWAHSFLRGPHPNIPGDQGDFALFSFYKHAPSFAGGGLRVNAQIAWSLPSQESAGIQQTALIIKRLLEQAIENSPEGKLKDAFQKFEEWRVKKRRQSTSTQMASDTTLETPYELSERLERAGIPWLSRQVLHASRWTTLFEAKRRNYEYLAQNLEENPWLRKVHPTLPSDVCPWAFPVWMAARADQDVQLRARGVPLFTFGDVLHPVSEQSPPVARKDAEALSRHLLLLSVHQNLELADMKRTARIINDFYRGRS
jgi:perosamine synthetase